MDYMFLLQGVIWCMKCVMVEVNDSEMIAIACAESTFKMGSEAGYMPKFFLKKSALFFIWQQMTK